MKIIIAFITIALVYATAQAQGFESQSKCKASFDSTWFQDGVISSYPGKIIGKDYATVDKNYRTMLPVLARNAAVLVQAIPSKDNSILALVYVTCPWDSNDNMNVFKTYLVTVDKEYHTAKLVAQLDSYEGANICKVYAGNLWIGSSYLFIMKGQLYGFGAGGSYAKVPYKVYNMKSAKKVRELNLWAVNVIPYADKKIVYYYDNKDSGQVSGEISGEILSTNILTGKTMHIKSIQNGWADLCKVKKQNGEWVLYYRIKTIGVDKFSPVRQLIIP